MLYAFLYERLSLETSSSSLISARIPVIGGKSVDYPSQLLSSTPRSLKCSIVVQTAFSILITKSVVLSWPIVGLPKSSLLGLQLPASMRPLMSHRNYRRMLAPFPRVK